MIAKIEIYILGMIQQHHYRKHCKCIREQLKCLNDGRYIGAEQWAREADRHLDICQGIATKRMEIAL